MGQRSQVIFNIEHTDIHGKTRTARIARHHQWVYGHFLVIRAAQVVHFLDALIEHKPRTTIDDLQAALPAIYGINQTNGDIQGLDQYSDVSKYRIEHMDNNDGYVVVDIRIVDSSDHATRQQVSYRIGILENVVVMSPTIEVTPRLTTAENYLRSYMMNKQEAGAYWPKSDLNFFHMAARAVDLAPGGERFTTTEQAIEAANRLVATMPTAESADEAA